MYYVIGNFGGVEKIWSGNGFGTEPELFTEYESGDDAQKNADALHLADCSFDHEKARRTINESRFVVRDWQTGEAFKPKPLVSSKHLFTRMCNAVRG
jgi:hypothetical protein